MPAATQYEPIERYPQLGNTGIAKHMRKIEPGPDDLVPRPRGIRVAVSGTIDFTNEDGSEEVDCVVIAGEVLRFPPKKITNVSGAVLYGYYDQDQE